MVEDEYERKKKKTKRIEALTTAGCGYGNAKKRILNAFWNGMWPKLLEGGWTKIDEAGPDEAATYFVPKGVNVKRGKKGRDYYDKVKSVLKRILGKGGDATEKNAAVAYNEMLQKLEKKSRKKKKNILKIQENTVFESSSESALVAKVKMKLFPGSGNKIQESEFPREISRVGDEYQALISPDPGSYWQEDPSISREGEFNETHCYTPVWDPNEASLKGTADFVHLAVPHNKKEAAMVLLHERNYVASGLFPTLNQLTPSDCSDWTLNEIDLFREAIFETRKNFCDVSKIVGKSVNDCIKFYLSTYKHSNDYFLLKTICAQDRNEKKLGRDNNTSQICKIDENIGMCLSCKDTNRNKLDCKKCLDKKVLMVQSYLLGNARKMKLRNSKKRKAEFLGQTNHALEPNGNFCDDTSIVENKIKLLSSSVNEDKQKNINENKTDKDKGISSIPSDIIALRKFASSISFVMGHERK